jgi:hypothetical protein
MTEEEIDELMKAEGLIVDDSNIDSLMEAEGLTMDTVKTPKQAEPITKERWKQGPTAWEQVLPTRMAMDKEEGKPFQKAWATVSDLGSYTGRWLGSALEPILPGQQRGNRLQNFEEGLADPSTGIFRPVQEASKKMMTDPESNLFQKGLAGVNYLGASALNSPSFSAGNAKNAIQKTGGLVKEVSGVTPKVIKGRIEKGLEKVGAENISKGTEKLAGRLQTVILKPTKANIRQGYKKANVFKYNLQGSEDEIYKKSGELIAKANSRVKQLIKEGKDGGVRVNLNELYRELDNELNTTAEKAKFFGNLPELKKALKKLEDDITEIAPNGFVNIADAQTLKKKMGSEGGWEHMAESLKASIPADSKIWSQIASRMALKLKKALEQKLPEGEIKDLNRIMSDLIPINNVAEARSAVKNRNLPFNVRDMAGGMATISSGWPGIAYWVALKTQDSPKTVKVLTWATKKLRETNDPKKIGQLENTLKKIGVTEAGINAIKAGKDITEGLPKRGEEKDGYIFKGGDPSQEKNWIKK